MAKETLQPEALSTTTFEDLIPSNFDMLAVEKQRTIVVQSIQEMMMQAVKIINENEKLEKKAKLNSQKLKLSKEYRELTECKKMIRIYDQQLTGTTSQIAGMSKLAKKLNLFKDNELEGIMAESRQISNE